MAPPTVPVKTLRKLRSICRRLPESFEEPATVGTRWMIRAKNFAQVVAIRDGVPAAYARAAGSEGPLVVLTFRASGMLYDTLRTTGAPYFQPEWGARWGTKVMGIALDPRTKWDAISVLVTASYRLLAPMKLSKLLDA